MKWMPMLILLVACPSGDADDSTPPVLDGARAIVTTTDYTDTLLASVDLNTLEVTDGLLAIASGDVVVEVLEGDLYVIDRSGGTLQRFDDGDLTGGPDLEFAVPDNPQRPLLCGGKLFVPRYDASAVGVFDARTGVEVGSIDVTAYAEPGGDGRAEPASVLPIDANTIAVALERYDFSTLVPGPDGRIVEIDCDTETVTAEHVVGPNPVPSADPSSDGWLVLEGRYFAADGLLRRFDRSDGYDPEPLLDEATLGGDITGFGATDEGLVYGVWHYGEDPERFEVRCLDGGVADDDLAHNVWSFRPAPSGEVWAFVLPPYTDPTLDSGIALIDPVDCDLPPSSAWLTFSLPPTGAAFLP